MLLNRMVFAAAATGLLASLAIAGPANAAVSSPGNAAARGSVMHAAVPLASAPESFRNVNTGRCVDAANAGLVEGLPCTFEPDQEWLVTVLSDGTRMLQNQANGTCLSGFGAHEIGLDICDTRDLAEHWSVARVTLTKIGAAIRFQNKASSGCLDDSVTGQLRVTGCMAVTSSSTKSTQLFR